MKRFWILFLLLPLLTGCHKNVTPEEEKQPEESSVYYVNWFGQTIMGTYYLWNQEISSALTEWETEMETDPIEKVQAIRYKADRWSMMTDDIESFTSSVAGVYKTTGFDFMLTWDATRTHIVGIVTFTYANSPARQAGLKRGDIFSKVNGEYMTLDNYVDILTESIYGNDSFKLTLYDGRTVTLIPVEMEEDAVNEVSVLEVGDKKVGYLHFTSFTLLSLKGLMEAFAEFKAAGIDELVLDLRYNGGGYVTTCNVLASAIAPLDVVNGGKVFSRDIMNSILTDAWGEDPACFKADYGAIQVNDDGLKVKCPAAEVNSNLSRLYVLVSPDSASASESLICGLKPYMDVVVIGEQTHGKFCAGFIIDAAEWFDDVQDQLGYTVYSKGRRQVKNWGIYVMYARYADCNGVTISMPDGIKPDIELEDSPLDGFQLGDPGETLLACALAHMNGGETPILGTRSASLGTLRAVEKPHRSGYGLLVKDWPKN